LSRHKAVTKGSATRHKPNIWKYASPQNYRERLQTAVKALLPMPTRLRFWYVLSDPKFGDYQSNALMSQAKARKLNPRQWRRTCWRNSDVSDLCEPVELRARVLNFRLKPSAVAEALQIGARGEHLFFEKSSAPRTVVVDFSSPNVAKRCMSAIFRSTVLGRFARPPASPARATR